MLLARLVDDPLTPLRAAAFWAAVLLPAVYLTLLAAGPSVAGGRSAFVGLLGLHACAIVVGHGHAQE